MKLRKKFTREEKKLLAHFLGMLLGDGGISIHKTAGKRGKDYEIYFVQKHKEAVIYFSFLVDKLFDIKGKVEQRKDGIFRYRIRSNKKFENYLRNNIKKFLGMIEENMELSIEFLRAFYGCEGSFHWENTKGYIEITNKNTEIIELISRILKRLNIHHNTYVWDNAYHLRIFRFKDIEKFIKRVGTLDVFVISRGKFKEMRKSDVFQLFLNSRTLSVNMKEFTRVSS